jgi:adhesin transport system outer membrane protein
VGVLPDELVVGGAPSEAIPPTLEDAIVRAVEENPAVLAAHTAVDARRSDAEAAEGAFVPRLDIELSASGEKDADGVRGTGRSLAALLVMRWNLYRGGGDSAILRGARERVSQQIMDERATRRLVEEQIRMDWSRLLTAQERLPKIEERVITSAQVVSAYRQQFELGQRTLLDVLDTENELFQSRVDLVQAEYETLFAHWAIISTLGQTLEIMGVDPAYTDDKPYDPESDPPLFLSE